MFAIYFLFPANLLIYGVNDIFDFETDRLNPKKTEKELLARAQSQRYLIAAIFLTNIPLLIVTSTLTPLAALPLSGFLFFSIYYSAPPIRAKARPVIDSIFNILYPFPGIIGYQLIAGKLPPLPIVAAGGLWMMAMHAYSALPDIQADRDSGLSTIATSLGARGTFSFCLVLYLASSTLVSIISVRSVFCSAAFTL